MDRRFPVFAMVSLGVALATSARALADQRLLFQPFAAFYASEIHVGLGVDPDVFVKDSSAPEGDGPFGIHHAAGVRPADLATDDRAQPAYGATGAPLGVSLSKWLAAVGSADAVTGAEGDVLRASFSNLIPNGHYALYRLGAGADGAPPAPLDGTGTSNGMVAAADGTAHATIALPEHLSPDSVHAIALVYTSDTGASPARPGVTAFTQLVAKVIAPAAAPQ